jgi:uncharacterized protein YqgV (UPF0045/DUF77 family)
MRCLDATVAATLFPDGEPSAPLGGDVPLPEACYRCIEKAYCSSNGTDCKWSNPFFECMKACTTPIVKPVINPCDVRTQCACLNVTTPKCFWCHYESTYTDESGNVVTQSLGKCLNPSMENKCTGPTDGVGYSGSLVTTKPEECDSTAISPNAVDPTTAIKDTKVADVIRKVTDGTFSTSDAQNILTAKGTIDIIINDVGAISTDADGVKGKFQLTLTNLGTKTTTEIVSAIKDALETVFQSTDNKVVIEVQISAATGAKRSIQQTNGNYVADTTVSAAPPAGPDPVPQPGTINPTPGTNTIAPSGSSLVSPVWFLALLLALPFWR